MLAVVRMVAIQGWYYAQIFSMARKGTTVTSQGCFRSGLQNDAHERSCAKRLEGIDCKGYVYKGIRKRRGQKDKGAAKGERGRDPRPKITSDDLLEEGGGTGIQEPLLDD